MALTKITGEGVGVVDDVAIAGHASVGVNAVSSSRALTVAGATDGSGSSILVCYNSSLASKFQVRDDGLVTAAGSANVAGNLLVGTTSTTPNPGVSLASTGAIGIGNSNGGSGTSFIEFRRNATQIGSITQSGTTGVAFNASSDYRLKENVDYTWDATTRLKQLKPARFNFIADADRTVDGFLAHEVQGIVPEAITGTKDEVDEDGNPVMQGIDQSKLVPLLVKTILELEARIAALETA